MTKSINNNSIQSTQHYRQATHATASMTAALPSPCEALAFPFNIYAHALHLHEGMALDLHFGLFQNDKISMRTAQQSTHELLRSKLPPSPCRILEVGIDSGTTSSLLNQPDYEVFSITVDTQQAERFKRNAKPQASARYQSLETINTEAKGFDIVLFKESAQYIDQLEIINKALDLLSPSGQLIVMGEFALKHNTTDLENLHSLKNMIMLAERSGFELIENLDLSVLAAPTFDYLLQAISTYRQRLIKDLFLNPEQLTQLEQSNRINREKYTNGEYGYALLRFRKKTAPRWHLQLLKENQKHKLFDLFKKTFNHTMTPATWQWKYGENASHALGVWQKDKLIAHYGGVARQILFFGQPQTAVQIADVMVDTSERGILTRKGPFFLMTAAFLEHYIGYGKPYLIGFGFPNERHMKIAERHGLYGEVGKMVEITWPPLSKFPHWRTRLLPITPLDNNTQIPLIVNECWQQMANDLQTALVGVRDWAYIQHRYLNHPTQHYQVVLIKNRGGDQTRGVLILRYDAHGCEIVDFIAPLAEIPLLVLHARRLAGINGQQRLFCRITENFAAHFAVAGGTRKTLDIRIPASTWDNAPSIDSLRNHWWLMSGDADFR
ncbi:GNAT family N-acetyltransferase [Nitrosomonas ureae]|uniref:Acetyltransferase (GNAT) domain-containing protein n=1 Tax=Nitrosomonas ureae TaxID=44577 RepID=A0A286A9J9_9PROT|nr:GNAT family N-acetyltransferase [Nitrosomonas ureae]SOD18583.1 Acetyltransferase (GNAT) domain-containing protein [Nitrosomonas ureae]